jgi:hypothetical protein
MMENSTFVYRALMLNLESYAQANIIMSNLIGNAPVHKNGFISIIELAKFTLIQFGKGDRSFNTAFVYIYTKLLHLSDEI